MSGRNINSIIFDLDGTLTDSLSYIAELLFKAMRSYLAHDVTAERIKKTFGPTERYVISRFVPEDKINSCLDLYNRLYGKEHTKVTPYKNVNETLSSLKTSGVKMFLCTGKSRETTGISLSKFGWNNYFKDVITGDDTKEFKPSPEGLNKIIDSNNLKRNEVIFIGDSQADIDAAFNARIKSGFALWSGKEVRGADFIAEDSEGSGSAITLPLPSGAGDKGYNTLPLAARSPGIAPGSKPFIFKDPLDIVSFLK